MRAAQQRAGTGRGICVLRLAVFALLLSAAPAGAQAVGAAPEQNIKAAYLYNFGAYVDWPAEVLPPDAPLTIAILQNEPVAAALEQITRDRRVNGRVVQVRRLAPGESLDGVQMLFVGADGATDLPALAAAARARSVLVITESGDGLRQGGVINFVMVDDRIRFEVSLDAADASRLAISSRLLAVAQQVLPRSQI